jgi:hypothetical protein
MSVSGYDSKLFEEFIRPMLQQGLSVRFQARGRSMSPAIRDGEIVEVTPVQLTELRQDDIVLAKSGSGFRLHRIVVLDVVRDLFITRGDCGQEDDPPLAGAQILGLARAKQVRLGWTTVRASFKRGGAIRLLARAQYFASKLLCKVVARPLVS